MFNATTTLDELDEASPKRCDLVEAIRQYQYSQLRAVRSTPTGRGRVALEGHRRQTEHLGRSQGPWEVLAWQPRLAAQVAADLLEHASDTVEILTDVGEALIGWLEQGPQTLMENTIAQWFYPITSASLSGGVNSPAHDRH